MTQSLSNTADAGRAPRENQLFWARYFAVYDTLMQARPYQAMIARQLELLNPQKGDRTLDAGTGSGNMAAAMVKRGAIVTGIDFCEPALVLARQKSPTATFQFGDLTRPLQFADGTFDLVACSAVLHVLSRDEQRFAVKELGRVLRPGGRLVITAFAEGFRALAVYFETLRVERKTNGVMAMQKLAWRYSWNTMRVLYYVWRIQRQQRRGAYAYVDQTSLKELLTAAGLTTTTLERTFADQCFTALASKPAPDGQRS
jgi:ubiquinone/menaquinone biosynthesis C-methylase UbiE